MDELYVDRSDDYPTEVDGAGELFGFRRGSDEETQRSYHRHSEEAANAYCHRSWVFQGLTGLQLGWRAWWRSALMCTHDLSEHCVGHLCPTVSWPRDRAA